MKNTIKLLVLSLAALAFAACPAGDGGNTNTGNENAGADPAKTLAATLESTEKEAYEAWKKKDGKFFNDFLTDGFVGVGQTGRGPKDGVEKGISENPCEVESYSTSDAKARELADGVALLTMKLESIETCDGKTTPSPEWSATVYVKDGDNWKAAYHQTMPTAKAKGVYPAGAPGDKPGDDADEELTKKLAENTKAGWDAWAKKDTSWFEENVAKEYTAITTRSGRSNREQRLKFHGSHGCEAKNISHSDHRSTKINDNVVLLTFKASFDATCDGSPVFSPVWTSSLWVKDGENWKSTFYMATPAA
ncbi:MAG: nuclear transport factor 2 family protein [Pyrinomonadaceae bacterium]|nr:nuclear transport factor 2 family protein [Pyrinomonadaceae bacterium]